MSSSLARAQATAQAFSKLAFYAVAGLAIAIVIGGLFLARTVFTNEMKPLKVLGTIKGFTGKERSGKTITNKDLQGSVWVAGFIFTRCSGPCPKVSGTMASLHRDPLLPGIRLVSFTVDPDFDDATILGEYAKNFGADQRWWFVTAPQKKMYEQIRENFMLPAEKAPKDAKVPVGESFSHSTRLVLVDEKGQIRGFYDSQKDETVRELRRAAGRLLHENKG